MAKSVSSVLGVNNCLDPAVTCESVVSREFSRFFGEFFLDLDLEAFSFHSSFSILMSRHSFHLSFSKWVKGNFVSLFIYRKEWKHFRFHSFSREKEWNYACNFAFVVLHPFRQAIWGHIWQICSDKGNYWGHLKPTVEKRQTNAVSVTLHPPWHASRKQQVQLVW